MNSPVYLVETQSLGLCWLQVSKAILETGHPARYEGASIAELAYCTMVIEQPDPGDPLIRKFGDPTWLNWMHENFFVQKPVRELGDAPSYALRLFNYASQGLDQIQGIIQRLAANSEARSATLTTFMPLSDTSYIPCISLLDFWIPEESLELVVYAHSLDFGKKAYGNLVELAHLQQVVGAALKRPVGRLVVHAKSVHIYTPEQEEMRRLIQTTGV